MHDRDWKDAGLAEVNCEQEDTAAVEAESCTTASLSEASMGIVEGELAPLPQVGATGGVLPMAAGARDMEGMRDSCASLLSR